VQEKAYGREGPAVREMHAWGRAWSVQEKAYGREMHACGRA